MAHSLALKRAGLSLLIAAHLAAVLIWNLPECALRERVGSWPAAYMLPTGQWQHWGMFAPEPLRETVVLEAQARDAQGAFHTYTFPRMADKSVAEAFFGYRHSKLAHNMAPETAKAYREFAARHAARSWELPPEAFPLDMDLYYKVWAPAAPGEPAADLSAPPTLNVLQAYRFPNQADVLP